MSTKETSFETTLRETRRAETTMARAYAEALPAPAPTVPAAAAVAPNAAPLAVDEIEPKGRVKPNLRQSFTALRHRNFRLFWTGQLVSLVGTWTQVIARSWLVYQLAANTGNQGFWLGMVGIASSVPVL